MYQDGHKGEEWWRMGNGLLLTFQKHRSISILGMECCMLCSWACTEEKEVIVEQRKVYPDSLTSVTSLCLCSSGRRPALYWPLSTQITLSVTWPLYFKYAFYLLISKYIQAFPPIALMCRQEGFSLFTPILESAFCNLLHSFSLLSAQRPIVP